MVNGKWLSLTILALWGRKSIRWQANIRKKGTTYMTNEAESPVVSKNEQPDLPMDLYKEICNNIRATDEISFKLLGLVPILSGFGSGALTMLEKSGWLLEHTKFAVISLSLLGAIVTVGLFIWELRNIQKCASLVKCAAEFEQRLLERGLPMIAAPFTDILKDRPRWGKTEAEWLIYITAIVAWLVPAAIAFHKLWK
jgi:hypothetical protein